MYSTSDHMQVPLRLPGQTPLNNLVALFVKKVHSIHFAPLISSCADILTVGLRKNEGAYLQCNKEMGRTAGFGRYWRARKEEQRKKQEGAQESHNMGYTESFCKRKAASRKVRSSSSAFWLHLLTHA